eukprot:scpid27634/ scgid1962/ 
MANGPWGQLEATCRYITIIVLKYMNHSITCLNMTPYCWGKPACMQGYERTAQTGHNTDMPRNKNRPHAHTHMHTHTCTHTHAHIHTHASMHIRLNALAWGSGRNKPGCTNTHWHQNSSGQQNTTQRIAVQSYTSHGIQPYRLALHHNTPSAELQYAPPSPTTQTQASSRVTPAGHVPVTLADVNAAAVCWCEWLLLAEAA